MSKFRDPMARRGLSYTRPLPRRGVSQIEGAMYIGVSSSKFLQLVADGRMPRSAKVDGRKIWDLRAIDAAFDELLYGSETSDKSWDDFNVGRTAP